MAPSYEYYGIRVAVSSHVQKSMVMKHSIKLVSHVGGKKLFTWCSTIARKETVTTQSVKNCAKCSFGS